MKTRHVRNRENVHVRITKLFKTRHSTKRGLMFKKTPLGVGCGAWFQSRRRRPMTGVWMKNTYIPLDAIVVDKQHRVLETVQNMTPLSEKVHRFQNNPSDIDGFVEVDSGFVNNNNIRKGTKIHGIKSVFK
jgi:uncharacterized membrane protein (UPF0127 family)